MLHEAGGYVPGLKLRIVHDLQMERNGRLDAFNYHRLQRPLHAGYREVPCRAWVMTFAIIES